MVVYADILVLLNMLVDYFLLSLTSCLVKNGASVLRQLVAAFLGGLSSLAIFLPELGMLPQILINVAISAVLCFAAFGFLSFKAYFRSCAVFFAVSIGFAGAMLALCELTGGIIVRNSVFYMNISPIFLIVFSVVSYFVVLIVRAAVKKDANTAERLKLRLCVAENYVELDAISDTGNSIEDNFGVGEVIIADRAVFELIFKDLSPEELKRRYRLLPCSTVAGNELLEGYRCDKAYILTDKKTTELSRPILAISKTALSGDYSAIINPAIME